MLFLCENCNHYQIVDAVLLVKNFCFPKQSVLIQKFVSHMNLLTHRGQINGLVQERRNSIANALHDDVIKWKHFPRYWPFVRGIHRSPMNSPHKGQWRGALMLSLICVWINGWVNNGEAGDLRFYRVHYDVTVMRVRLSFTNPSKMMYTCISNLGHHWFR